MGCGASSKSVGVIEVTPCTESTKADSAREEPTAKSPMKSATLSMVPLQIEKKNASATDSGIGSHHNRKLDNESYDSDGISERKNSISSDDCSIYSDQEYKNVITEKSDPNLIQKVEKAFVERDLGIIKIMRQLCLIIVSSKITLKIWNLNKQSVNT
jgi:hypothetical protein